MIKSIQHGFIVGKSCLITFMPHQLLWWSNWCCDQGEGSGCFITWFWQLLWKCPIVSLSPPPWAAGWIIKDADRKFAGLPNSQSGADYIKNSPAEKDLEVSAKDKLNTKQQCDFAAKKPKSILGCTGKSAASWSRQIQLEYSIQFGSLQYKCNVGILEQVQLRATILGWSRARECDLWRKVESVLPFHPGENNVQAVRGLTSVYKYVTGAYREGRARLFFGVHSNGRRGRRHNLSNLI